MASDYSGYINLVKKAALFLAGWTIDYYMETHHKKEFKEMKKKAKGIKQDIVRKIIIRYKDEYMDWPEEYFEKKIVEFENNGMIAEQEAFERLYASYKEKKNHK